MASLQFAKCNSHYQRVCRSYQLYIYIFISWWIPIEFHGWIHWLIPQKNIPSDVHFLMINPHGIPVVDPMKSPRKIPSDDTQRPSPSPIMAMAITYRWFQWDEKIYKWTSMGLVQYLFHWDFCILFYIFYIFYKSS